MFSSGLIKSSEIRSRIDKDNGRDKAEDSRPLLELLKASSLSGQTRRQGALR